MDGLDDIPLLDLDSISNLVLEEHRELEKGNSNQKLKLLKGPVSAQRNLRKNSEDGALD